MFLGENFLFVYAVACNEVHFWCSQDDLSTARTKTENRELPENPTCNADVVIPYIRSAVKGQRLFPKLLSCIYLLCGLLFGNASINFVCVSVPLITLGHEKERGILLMKNYLTCLGTEDFGEHWM